MQARTLCDTVAVRKQPSQLFVHSTFEEIDSPPRFWTIATTAAQPAPLPNSTTLLAVERLHQRVSVRMQVRLKEVGLT